MIDFHSHILPNVDDGSRSVEMSIQMLSLAQKQGVDLMVATPHFYPTQQSPEAFLQKRNAAFQRLKPALTADLPKVYLGAEVQYYRGIALNENLSALTIENSCLLLIEMPFCKWSENIVSEVKEIQKKREIQVILAHIERYLEYNNRRVFEQFSKEGILLQMNAAFFEGFFQQRKAIKMVKSDLVHLLGSDCHNLTSRQPNLPIAYQAIEKKLGTNQLTQMDEFAHSLFQ